MSWNTNEKDLTQLFSKCGAIKRIFINHRKDLFAGTAFIEFENESSSEKAIMEYNGYNLNGQMLSISMHIKQSKEDKKKIKQFYVNKEEQEKQEAKKKRLDKAARHKAKLKRKRLRRMMRKQAQQ